MLFSNLKNVIKNGKLKKCEFMDNNFVYEGFIWKRYNL